MLLIDTKYRMERSQMNESDLLRENSPTSGEVAIDYVKSPDFRVVWCDGLIGGLTPGGNIHVALFAERPAIPRRVVYSVNEVSGELGNPIPEKSFGRNSIVRDMSCDVMMKPETAIRLAEWLVARVKEIQGGKNEL